MRRPVRHRLTVCLATVALTGALGGMAAPAASADPGRTTLLPGNVSGTSANASPDTSTGSDTSADACAGWLGPFHRQRERP